MSLARYSVRSLMSQRTAVLPTVLASALAVGIVTSLSLVISNIERVTLASGRADNLLVFQANADPLRASALPSAEVARLKLLPGVVPEQTGAEILADIRLVNRADNIPHSVVLRGVDPVAYSVHDAVHVTQGQAPNIGAPGLLVGSQRVGKMKGLAIGDLVRVGRQRWPVVGTFDAPGTLYDSELWCDRTALAQALNASTFTLLSGRAKTLADIATANEAAKQVRDPRISAMSEREYAQGQTAQLRPYIGTAWVLTIVLLVGATFACISTMHALFLRRLREFATLLAIGFTRGKLMAMLFVESVGLVAFGGAIGCALTALLIGRDYVFEDWSLVVHLQPAVDAFAYGGMLIGCVAVVGAGIGLFQLRRLVILDALRST